MRRWVVLVAALLSCFLFQESLQAGGPKRYLKKETRVSLNNFSRVFVGWIDMRPQDWSIHGYAEEADWATAIDRLNSAFRYLCETAYLPGRTVTVAKSKADDNAAGNDLHIRFSDVWIDDSTYYLYLSIHFIDPKTNRELASIPRRAYFQPRNRFFERHLMVAMEEVCRKLQVEVLGTLLKQ